MFTALIVLPVLFLRTYGLTADLKMLFYHPPTFNLTFNQNITQPKFQLLLNNRNLSYQIQPHDQLQSFFIIQVNQKQNLESGLQRYLLRFNQPLNLGKTPLLLNQYNLRPQMAAMQPKDLNWLAMIVVVICYSVSIVDIVGIWMVDFVQIYTLLFSNCRLAISFQLQAANYFLLQYPSFHEHDAIKPDQILVMMKMFIPIVFMIVALTAAIIFRKKCKNVKNYNIHLLKTFFTYHLLISLGFLFALVFVVNCIGFSRNSFQFDQSYRIVGGFLTYLGYFALFAFVLFELVVVNPRIKEKKQSFQQYQKTEHYKMFSKFVSGLKVQKWINRNFHFFILLKRIIISAVCAFIHDFYYVVLTLQVIHLFYIFTARPYQFSFYNNLGILVQSLVVGLYFYTFQNELYFKISQQIYTHETVITHNLARTIFFGFIFFILVLGNIYEIYERIVKVKIQHNNWQDQLDFYKTKKVSFDSQESSNRKIKKSNDANISIYTNQYNNQQDNIKKESMKSSFMKKQLRQQKDLLLEKQLQNRNFVKNE